MLIPFDNTGATVVGRTRSGKTYGVKKSLAAQKGGVLFFNTQLEDMPFTKADGSNNIEQIKAAMRAGKKINFMPSTVTAVRKAQLTYLINEFFDGSDYDFHFVVDEVHLYTDERESKDACVRLATTGLRFGIKPIWISQRGAKVDNTLMTQSTLFVFYETNMEGNYYKQYGIPHEEIEQRINAMPLHHCPDGQKRTLAYCTFDGKKVDGAFKV